MSRTKRAAPVERTETHEGPLPPDEAIKRRMRELFDPNAEAIDARVRESMGLFKLPPPPRKA